VLHEHLMMDTLCRTTTENGLVLYLPPIRDSEPMAAPLALSTEAERHDFIRFLQRHLDRRHGAISAQVQAGYQPVAAVSQ
jgi:hypothetical protein